MEGPLHVQTVNQKALDGVQALVAPVPLVCVVPIDASANPPYAVNATLPVLQGVDVARVRRVMVHAVDDRLVVFTAARSWWNHIELDLGGHLQQVERLPQQLRIVVSLNRRKHD